MEVAWVGGTYKRFFTVLVVVPSGFKCNIMANVDGQCGEWLVVVVLERSEGLQTVELRSLTPNTCNAVTQLSGDPMERSKHGVATRAAKLRCVHMLDRTICELRSN